MTPLVFVETANMATCQWKIANLLGLFTDPGDLAGVYGGKEA
jgi:hypothetical protein